MKKIYKLLYLFILFLALINLFHSFFSPNIVLFILSVISLFVSSYYMNDKSSEKFKGLSVLNVIFSIICVAWVVIEMLNIDFNISLPTLNNDSVFVVTSFLVYSQMFMMLFDIHDVDYQSNDILGFIFQILYWGLCILYFYIMYKNHLSLIISLEFISLLTVFEIIFSFSYENSYIKDNTKGYIIVNNIYILIFILYYIYNIDDIILINITCIMWICTRSLLYHGLFPYVYNKLTNFKIHNDNDNNINSINSGCQDYDNVHSFEHRSICTPQNKTNKDINNFSKRDLLNENISELDDIEKCFKKIQQKIGLDYNKNDEDLDISINTCNYCGCNMKSTDIICNNCGKINENNII